MPYVNMIDMLKKATAEGYAVGAFNILNELTARAIVAASEEQRAPVILQTSVATVKQLGATVMGTGDDMREFQRHVARAATESGVATGWGIVTSL